jgi:DNA (cytosine-5)-methyltransferase 1
MTAYYNENDPYAAQWLRNLIAAGHIAPGDVDARSIVDVKADDLKGYEQAHFFAGIGGWSYALRLAGWPDSRPVWTGSCPCQPFSAAGAGNAGDDGRHLWPAWFSLIAERRPAIVLGEQVEAAIGWGWLDLVFANLEGQGYACGAAILPACSVGAPHIRQRLWFVADSDGGDASAERLQRGAEQRQFAENGGAGSGDLAHAASEGSFPGAHSGISRPKASAAQQRGRDARRPAGYSGAGELADTLQSGWPEGRTIAGDRSPAGSGGIDQLGDADSERETAPGGFPGRPGTERQRSPWAKAEWIECRDGKKRPVEPGTFPLATGIPGRMGRLRAFGNAIVPQVAAEFINAFMECQP